MFLRQDARLSIGRRDVLSSEHISPVVFLHFEIMCWGAMSCAPMKDLVNLRSIWGRGSSDLGSSLRVCFSTYDAPRNLCGIGRFSCQHQEMAPNVLDERSGHNVAA